MIKYLKLAIKFSQSSLSHLKLAKFSLKGYEWIYMMHDDNCKSITNNFNIGIHFFGIKNTEIVFLETLQFPKMEENKIEDNQQEKPKETDNTNNEEQIKNSDSTTKAKEANEMPNSGDKIKAQTSEEKDIVGHRIFTETIQHIKDEPQKILVCINTNMFCISNCKSGKGESKEDKKQELYVNKLKVDLPNKLVKMQWFYIKKLTKTFCVLLDCTGKLSVGYLTKDSIEIIHERNDLLNADLLLTSVVSITMNYMGGGNFKVIICSNNMTIIDYNFNVITEEQNQGEIMQITEVHDISAMHDLPTQFIYR